MARAAFILFAFLCLLAGILSARIERGGDISGRWEGELQTAIGPEAVVLTVLRDGREHAGSLEMQEQTLDLTGILLRGDSVRLQLRHGISVEAVLNGADMEGTLHLRGERQPLTLHRVTGEPQTRTKSWSMKTTRLFKTLRKVHGLFERRRTSTPTTAAAPF